jgi:hypothetical protein
MYPANSRSYPFTVCNRLALRRSANFKSFCANELRVVRLYGATRLHELRVVRLYGATSLHELRVVHLNEATSLHELRGDNLGAMADSERISKQFNAFTEHR